MSDVYVETTIKQGDTASDIAAKLTLPTMSLRDDTVVLDPSMGGLRVVKPASGSKIVLYSVSGNPMFHSNAAYLESMMKRIFESSRHLGIDPIAISDVLDFAKIDKDQTISTQAYSLLARFAMNNPAGKPLAILNGESAELTSEMVTHDFNAIATVIGYIDPRHECGIFSSHGIVYAVIDPHDKYVYMNSDGVGTKVLIHQQFKTYKNALYDAVAMLADDTIKKGADLQYVSLVLEHGSLSKEFICGEFANAQQEFIRRYPSIPLIIQPEHLGGRLAGRIDRHAFNLGGSVISLLDEEQLCTMPQPQEGDAVLLVYDAFNQNPRSNGVSRLRDAMTKKVGRRWERYTHPDYSIADFVSAPSTIFYPAYKELLDENAASGFFHMSGGSHDGKLARPFARLRLYTELSDLNVPHPFMYEVMNMLGISEQDAYRIFPMNNNGYITTSCPQYAPSILRKHGLESRVVGTVMSIPGMTGVSINTPTGAHISYDGFS